MANRLSGLLLLPTRAPRATIARNDVLPPSSREDAIRDARASLWGSINKPLQRRQRLWREQTKSSKKQPREKRQARFVIEMPLLNESQEELASLLKELLQQSQSPKNNPFRACVILGTNAVRDIANETIGSFHQTLSLEAPESQEFDAKCDFVMVLAPDSIQIPAIERIAAAAGDRPIVVVNPSWEDDSSSSEFCRSFEVAYSYTPLSIQGFFLSKMEGAILRSMPASPWRIFTKSDDGRYKCVSSAMDRPSQQDLEDALYNSVASNSPIVKSLDFLKNIVRNKN